MSHRLLVVISDEDENPIVPDTLAGAGYAVKTVRTFEEAVRLLAEDPPDLLITALRLGRFNGVHLVLRSRVLHPDMPSLVVGHPGDRSTELDRLEVQFLPLPVQRKALLESLVRLLDGRPPVSQVPRRWPRKPAHLPATVFDSTVDVIELSYGGIRLKGTARQRVGSSIAVRFPTLDLTVNAVARWTKPLPDGASWCGAEIMDLPMAAVGAWRGVVDSMN